ncbi:MAG: SIR2 family protein [Acidobacteriaceae bacterium]|nr:SIR2 family protein [Acidobacteriaceae bacterium]
MKIGLVDSADTHLSSAIRSRLSNGDVVLFAGSGLSAQAATDDGQHPPLWAGLLRGMVSWCREQAIIDSETATELNTFIEQGYLIEAGQEIQDVLSESSQLGTCLRDVIHCNGAPKIGKAHALIAELPFRAILTTNYDGFIETAFAIRHKTELPRFFRPELMNGVVPEYMKQKPFIVKLHGDLNDPKSIVLGYRQYERLLYDDQTYRYCLETIFGTSSVLFIGFGGSDPDLESIISRVSSFTGRRRAHWMLVPRGTFPYLKAKRMLVDKGITVIEYEKDSMHTGVIDFLERLRVTT